MTASKTMYKLQSEDGGTFEVKQDADGNVVVLVDGVVKQLGLQETITGAKTLDAEDNGKTFILNAAAGAAITLPALAAGLKYKFIVGAVFATSNWTVTSAEGDNIEGALMVASTVVDVNAADVITFVNSAENIGDWVTLECDGTYWYADGRALTTGAITATG